MLDRGRLKAVFGLSYLNWPSLQSPGILVAPQGIVPGAMVEAALYLPLRGMDTDREGFL